ncbi:hypothetical protein CRM22_009546 [Opisthorchis felineus]|uniref:BAR domain-containing protein n=1 Tax=Opisthorchis felineus TaxID=147828 RepID=A0A4S2L777_OPIFE|nr:hypothetical protein CRM22_009546 [Opisthorchis felineus]
MSSSISQNTVSRATQIKECENQAKFVQQRVNAIEAFFGDLCAELVSYTRRTAKLRNNGDEIARILLDYSVKEKINRSSANTLKRVSEHFATLEDYRHTEVDRLVGKVVNPLASYGNEIKNIRANLKTENAARKKEISSRRKLERSTTAEQARLAEIQLHNSIIDANRSADKLERCVVEFEARRLKGLKNILKDFIQIEMLWHAKALETLSEAFNVLQNLQEESDLMDFRATLMRSTSSVFSQAISRQTVTPNQNQARGDHPPPVATQVNGERSTHRGSGDKARGHHTEDDASLFSTDEEEEEEELETATDEEDEEEEDAEEEEPTNQVSHSSRPPTEVLDDLEDDETEDTSETTQAPPAGSARRASVQGNKQLKTTAPSPLKSALKSSQSKQAVCG